jgi:hypothetical protein
MTYISSKKDFLISFILVKNNIGTAFAVPFGLTFLFYPIPYIAFLFAGISVS